MKKRFIDNPELRQKCSEAQKKRFEDPEERQKRREAQKKRFENPETRQKCREAQKKRFENPEARQKHCEVQKKRFIDNPELRKKILDGMGRNKPFDVLKKDGTYIKSFDYQFEAREYLQKTYDIKTHIDTCAVLKGKQKSSRGFIFKYKE